jgi:hypothetical protein
MTERSLGANFKWFIAKVVNRGDGKEGDKDSTESGRVQIRIYGKHDDVKNVPDKQLPWAVPLLPIGTGASKKGVGASPVGLQKDSTVVGFYADKDETIPILFGVLHKAGTDKGDDGTELEKTNNDVPKGARSQETGGGDKNDVLDKRMTEEVGKEGQHHKDKKTIGDVPFQGEPALDAIKKIDPSNLSGSIPGAMNGMKSIVNTLGVAGSLLANFKALTSGKLSITGLLAAATNISGATSQLTGQLSGVGGAVGQIAGGVSQITGVINQTAATTLVQNFGGVPVNMVVNGRQGVTAKFGNVLINISHRYDASGNVISSSGNIIRGGVVVGSGNMAQIAIIARSISPQAGKILAGVQAASIASNLIGSAFGGGNPLQTVINGLGGLSGLQSLAAKGSSLLGPLTANFGAAVAIAGSLRSQTQIAFAGLQAAPFRSAGLGGIPIPTVLGKIGNIAGVAALVAGASRIVSGNIPIVPAIAGALGNSLNIPSSLINSSIQIPLTTLAVINTLNRRNPGVSIGFDNRNTVIPRVIPLSRPYVSPAIINPIRYTNPSFRISSLNNTVLSVNIPILDTRVIFSTINSTPGIGYNVSGIGIKF